MRPLIRRLWSSTSVWRMTDAYAPRVFGLVIHTALVFRYGAEAYALPTWCLGVLGVAVGFIPDPHSLILVRRSGKAARRLLALTTPWVALKLLIAAAACWAGAYLFCAQSLLEAHGASTSLVIGAAILFGSVESAWAVIGTASLAVGNVRRVAITGVLSRTVSVGLMLLSAQLHASRMWLDLVFASAPALLALSMLAPFRIRVSRNVLFMWFATKRYGVWSQGIALSTALLFQAPVLVLGALPLAPAAGVGQISYVTRVIGAALQPVQILQSLVVREFAVSRGALTRRLSTLRLVMRMNAVGIAVVGMGGLYVTSRGAVIEPGVRPITGMLIAGIAFSSWFRFELSEVIATHRIRELMLLGYLPVLALAAAIGAGLIPLVGIVGLAISLAVGWFGTALSWKWVAAGA